MRRTVFDRPIVKTIFQYLAIIILKSRGCRMEGKLPNAKKYVLIAAPHTSNSDFFYTFLMALAYSKATYVGVLRQLSLIVSVYFGWKYLNDSITHFKITGVILILAGGILIIFAK